MKNTKWFYAIMLAALVCCVVFTGCPTAEEMVGDVIQPMDDDTDFEADMQDEEDANGGANGDTDGDDGGDTTPDPGEIPPPPPPGEIPPPPLGN